jgi:hypothetical protein
MKVYIATVVHVESTEIIGVYSSEDVALGKLDIRMDELYDNNEDYGCYPELIEVYIDDKDSDTYL